MVYLTPLFWPIVFDYPDADNLWSIFLFQRRLIRDKILQKMKTTCLDSFIVISFIVHGQTVQVLTGVGKVLFHTIWTVFSYKQIDNACNKKQHKCSAMTYTSHNQTNVPGCLYIGPFSGPVFWLTPQQKGSKIFLLVMAPELNKPNGKKTVQSCQTYKVQVFFTCVLWYMKSVEYKLLYD